MSTVYNYAYSAFTSSGGVVSLGQLIVSVQSSAILVQLEHINTDDDTTTVAFSFASSLSGAEVSILNNIVATHNGQPLLARAGAGLENSILTDDANGTIIIDDTTGNVLVNA